MRGKQHEFSEDDIKYIVQNWEKESAHSMKKKFGCTWYAVCKVAQDHGLKLPESNEWTDEQINELKELSQKYDKAQIAKIMGKSENAIYLKAKRLEITLIQRRRKWTKEEEDLLRELWGSKSIEYIANKLKRTVFSIKVQAVKMGIGPMINNNLEILTISDVSELLNISRDRITITWVKLGLNLKKLKLTKKRSYYTVTLEDLMDFLEKNQNEWDSRNVEVNTFGIEPEWFLKKRENDRNENPQWYRKWTNDEIKRAEQLFKLGKSYEEISVAIDRSEWAVANLLRNMGYSYKLPQFWQGKDLKFLRENYYNMTYAEIAEELGRTEGAVRYKAEELGYQKRLKK